MERRPKNQFEEKDQMNANVEHDLLVEQTIETHESEIIELSLSDLDIVGGGDCVAVFQ